MIKILDYKVTGIYRVFGCTNWSIFIALGVRMKGRLAPGVWTVVAVIRACTCKSYEVKIVKALSFINILIFSSKKLSFMIYK